MAGQSIQGTHGYRQSSDAVWIYSDDVPLPDISPNKAQQYIGLDISTEKAAKEKFLKEVIPMWIREARDKRIAGSITRFTIRSYILY